MPTLSTPIDQWTELTVHSLVADQVNESLTVEFKRDMPYTQPRDRIEVAKDIAAMANAAGGWIIYGVDELVVGSPPMRVAAATVPLTGPPDAARWVDDVVAGNVTPRPRVRIRELSTTGGLFVVVYVHSSATQLHMVADRYYRRSEQGARPMTEPEVRQAYELITRERSEAASYGRSVMVEEQTGAPEHGFLIAVIPHTFGDAIDTAILDARTPAFQVLGNDVLRQLSHHALGIEAAFPSRRFRVRRDGTVSVCFTGFGADNWRPDQFLNECLQALSVARTLWKQFGVRQPATLAVRSRFPKARPPVSTLVHILPGTSALPEELSFDIPVEMTSILGEPLEVARRAIDRFFNAMGQPRSPYFTDDAQLARAVVQHLERRLVESLRAQ